MKPLTSNIAKTLKLGTKLICVNDSSSPFIRKNEVYTLKQVVDLRDIYGMITLNEKAGPYYMYRFALFDKNYTINMICSIANRGRKAADILLKRYPDKFEVKNGLYKSKN